jgi:ribosome maturation factor RimP
VAGKQELLIELLEPVIESMGFDLWGLEFHSNGKNQMLRIYIDSENGIGIDDCSGVSRQCAAILDVEDPIQSEYQLEVSSPGIDRPLYKLDQFARYIGHKVKLQLRFPYEGQRKYTGTLTGVENEDLVLAVADHEYLFPVDGIEKASLIWQDNI